MISKLLSGLMAPDPAPLSDDDARLALTALLVRVARADGVYDDGEVSQINAVIEARYALDATARDTLRHEAEALEAEAPDTVRFTSAIKDAVAIEERLSVIDALWAVVLSDGVRDDEEDAMLRMVAKFLGISDRDSNIARLNVQKRLGL